VFVPQLIYNTVVFERNIIREVAKQSDIMVIMCTDLWPELVLVSAGFDSALGDPLVSINIYIRYDMWVIPMLVNIGI
jgi:acetoin utilization deacetylase AcuC-like enzyme